jgi:2,4-dienoyl-CoA reductase-like NADH-dependent reductase (Old Yellow Enzyme family)/thioredoxin reductase
MELFTPIGIKGWKFANRAVMAPMVPNLAGEDGAVTDDYKSFYLARARGGVGFIILGAAYVHEDGQGFRRQLGIHQDELTTGLANLAQSLGDYTRVGIQLSFKDVGKPPETYQYHTIEKYRKAFCQAAARAQDVGFDAIELHACHDYWLNYFLSPHFNHRTDEYGGSLENRFRLLRETVQSIRAQVGSAILLGVRLSMAEFVEDGLTLTETLEVGRWLEDLSVDYISASGGIGMTQFRMSPPMEVERGSLLPLARALKETVSLPVIGVGRLDRPEVFRGAITGAHADLAAAARALVADPQYVAKMLTGREKEIRPCIACNFCLLCLHRNEPIRCAVNPYVGRDLLVLEPLHRKRRILVVGGGPAGLSAAATAAKRGAWVKLFEKQPSLGGAVNLAKLPPHKGVLQDLTDYLVREAKENGVEIRTGQEVTEETLRDEAPDLVILATGATSVRPHISGLESTDRHLSPEQLLTSERVFPGSYLVVGGGVGGLEIADFLAHAGVAATVIEMTEQVGRGLHSTRLHLLLERLTAAGVMVLNNTRLVSILDGMVRVETPDDMVSLGPFDFIVFAVGYRSDRTLVQTVGLGTPLIIVGDANEPGSINEAIKDGFEAALDLEP